VRILVVEDNESLSAAIASGLRAHGFAVDTCATGAAAEEAAGLGGHDLLVLDVMLPDRDGIELCRSLRRRGLATPILMLTALGTTASKVNGLDAGADDYLTKPFDFEELLARTRALLRRHTPGEATRLSYGPLEMDLLRRTVKKDGELLRLSAKEFALLEFLMRNRERVLDRTTIAQKVWDTLHEPSSNVIEVYISALRRKLGRGDDRQWIHTVIGAGYRFGEPPERAAEAT
jgi:DNA-binding response OmpR family regulator